MSRIGPGNNDRAWNDPPQLAFSPSSSNQSSGSRLRMMNKRIPVPMNNSIQNPSGSPPPGQAPMMPLSAPPMVGSSIGPPPTTGSLITGVPPTKVDVISTTSDSISSQDMLEKVNKVLRSTLHHLSSRIQENIKNDVSKRLDILYSMWQDGKLNNIVHNKLHALTKAISTEEFDEAWSIHRSLIVDYTGICSQWMFAVKVIITETRNFKTSREIHTCSDDTKSDANTLDTL